MMDSKIVEDHRKLLQWYRQNRRDLPWRQSRDPYRIWISEVMLQQTTVAAVIPYYEKFLKLFPNVKALATAPESEVLQAWAGLGYYSRARNLHKAAKALAEKGFPRTAAELIEYPGFGPYTSAAVASIAFDDPSGVLDGNVIRVLCRREGQSGEWWNSKIRNELQERSNHFAKIGSPSEINQALMELGATVCTPQSPTCLLCPWSATCETRAQDKIKSIPRAKPRKKIEAWTWQPIVKVKNKKVALIENLSGPVLRGQWIFPGKFKPTKAKPKKFDARHGITHHDIFIQVDGKGDLPKAGVKWIPLDQLSSVSPSKILQKVLQSQNGRA